MQAMSLGNEGAGRFGDLAAWSIRTPLRLLQILLSIPSYLFLAALTAMLFRHPDVPSFEFDRLAFVLLVLSVLARALLLRRNDFAFTRATWPMLGLIVLAIVSVTSQPFNPETWSLLASKLLVPFALFHIAGAVFEDERSFRYLEVFAFLVLAYLSFTAIAFLAGTQSLIFPRFILDESIGFHADRARGPFLQAVANGVSINMLALIVLHAYRRGAVRGMKTAIVLASVPIAILAVMTRAVWLGFAGTVVALVFLEPNRRLKRAGVVLLIAIGLALLVVFSIGSGGAVNARLEERGPVDYREAVYAGGWEMFWQRPLLGWGFHQMPAELPRHVSGYREKVLYPHNTYLEILVEHGVVGLALYLWLMWELWKLRRSGVGDTGKRAFLGAGFHRFWPIMLGIYWVNAVMVVMSYQFVNALLFTMAGLLAAQRRSAQRLPAC